MGPAQLRKGGPQMSAQHASAPVLQRQRPEPGRRPVQQRRRVRLQLKLTRKVGGSQRAWPGQGLGPRWCRAAPRHRAAAVRAQNPAAAQGLATRVIGFSVYADQEQATLLRDVSASKDLMHRILHSQFPKVWTSHQNSHTTAATWNPTVLTLLYMRLTVARAQAGRKGIGAWRRGAPGR